MLQGGRPGWTKRPCRDFGSEPIPAFPPYGTRFMNNTSKLIVFVGGTIFILWFSWRVSLKERRYHGIFRIFSFESILILILINTETWFRDVLAVHQLFSWAALTFSAFLAANGFYLLAKMGRSKAGFEKTTRIVSSGAYKYIRHPMYCSLILLGLGAYLKSPFNGTGLLLNLVNILFLYLTAKTDEKEMLKKFGEDYRLYMEKTRMFIPYIF